MTFSLKKISNSIFIVVCLLFAFSFSTLAQETYTVKGFLYDEDNGEPLAFVTIKVENMSAGARTNVNGYFSIPNLPQQNIKLIASSLGYETETKDITLGVNKIETVSIYMHKKAKSFKGVDITAHKVEKINEVNIGTTKITAKDIKNMPAVGGEPDIAQYLQLTPGVVFTGDQGGELYIRGGSPVQNKVLLDGMTIYNPFHSIGLYSVFETDLIRNADIITGGFNAEYNDRTSSIVDIATKDGNKKKLSGKISLSPIMGRVMLEGPLSNSKNQKNLQNISTFLFSAKHAFIDNTSKTLYGGLGNITKEVGLPYKFTDIYGKLTFGSSAGSKINVFGFNNTDANNFPNIASFKWNSYGLGSNFILSPSNSSMLISSRVAYSSYTIKANDETSTTRTSSINGFEGNLNFTYFLPNFSEVKFGVELEGFSTKYSFLNDFNIHSSQDQYTTQIGGYVRYRKNIKDKLILEPSLRLNYYSSLSTFSPEPRFGMKYNFKPNFRFKFATGKYTQNLISTKSDVDIVNYFTGFLSGPEDDLLTVQGKVAANNIQKAFHLISGIEYDISKKIELVVEPWYKFFYQNINFNRNKITNNDPDFIIEQSKAKGIDLAIKYTSKKLRLNLVYSHMQILTFYRNYLNQIESYPPPYDRRNNMNFVASYNTGRNDSWELACRFSYGSALPFTLTQAFYQKYDVSGSGSGTNFLEQNGNLNLVYFNKINTGRLSDYHRIDVSAQKTFALKNGKALLAQFSITNVYDRRNIFYINRLTNSRIYQLPILPSISLVYKF